MLSDIKFQYPTWFLLLCLLLGLAYAAALYYRDHRFDESPRWSRLLMPILRTLSVASIATLLLSPLIKTTTEEVKQPIIVIAQDASQSIVSGVHKDSIANITSDLSALSSSLGEMYEIKNITIGNDISEGTVDSFTSNITNLSAALEYIDDNFSDQNLGAIILATDGIYNEGKNPIYTKTNITAPLYIVALGDTSIRRDISIKNVFANKISYFGDKFSIQIDISSINASASVTTLSVSKIIDGKPKKLSSSRINIDNSNYFTTKEVVIDADQVGVVKYRISLSPIANEVSKANNYRDIFIEVLDARQKILLLANAPHPDLSALKSIISNNKNYEAEIAYIQDASVAVSTYDMVVLHNLPSITHNIAGILAEMDRRRIPRLYIVGAQSSPSVFNSQQDIVSIVGDGKNTEAIQASIVSNFSSFTISENLSRRLGQFPPLVAPFGGYRDPLGSNILLKQKIKDIDTNYPLLSFRDKNGYKTGVWVGEGIWKWKLYNYLQSQNYDLVEELVNKTIQYISTKEDKRKFRSSTSKNIYKENEDILFDAQLYNDNYEMVNTPDVFVTVKNKEGNEYKYTLSRTNNYYTLNAKLLTPGKYSYTASTNFNGAAMNQKGYFSVEDIQLELYDLTARHGLLRSLSNKYGGKVVLPNNTMSLVEALSDSNKVKPVIYSSTKTKSVINFRWLFWILLSLLCGEWFVRRYMGNY